jgi:uncharacterized protein (TIGR03435 family)
VITLMRRSVIVAILTAAAVPLAGQEPAFEVASIRPSGELTMQSRGGLTITKQQARFALLSLNDYIGIAFEVKLHQIVGPDWLGRTRFDIAATIPANVPPEQLSAMLRTLLQDRFRLRTHREQREFAVYALEVLPNVTLEPAKEDTPPEGAFSVTSGPNNAGGATVELGQGATLVMGNNRLEARKVTMQTMADILGRFVDKPVIDLTRLAGRYNITFGLQPEDFGAMMIRSAIAAGVPMPPEAMQLLDRTSPAAVPDALRGAGLSLTNRRAPLEVLVIDSIENSPTEN